MLMTVKKNHNGMEVNDRFLGFVRTENFGRCLRFNTTGSLNEDTGIN